jgi:uncharacterized YigZ family protein
MKLYRTVKGNGEAELVIERSRFISHVFPINSFEEGRERLEEIRTEYRDATHNVPAIIFGEKQEMQWTSDDGEPQGTSGPPMLRLAVDEGLTNLCIVVTRYFGGIKLGTGGLVRAYSSAARAGIEAAGICDVYESVILTYTIDYPHLARIQNAASGGLFHIDDAEYTDKVRLTVSAEKEADDRIEYLFREITAGCCVLEKKEFGHFTKN